MMALRGLGLSICLAALLLVSVGQCRAQSAILAEASPALGCARVAEGSPVEPEYPYDLYKRGEVGRVVATVTLPAGPLGNRVEILLSEGEPSFVEATRKFLRQLEAPCLKQGETATLKYDFKFQRDGRPVVWNRPTDGQQDEAKDLAQCVRHLRPGSLPEYPDSARRRQKPGRVLALLRFTSADGPPIVKLLHRPWIDDFDSAIRFWTAGLRLPCYKGRAVAYLQTFDFVLEGQRPPGFKPLTLSSLLAVAKSVRANGYQLDTTALACPFDLKLTYFQPLYPNSVGEVGEARPERRPLLESLASIELELSDEMKDAVFGDTAEVAVPCVKIDLKPKEKKS